MKLASFHALAYFLLPVPRTITHRYEDPLDAIWLACARAMGLVVKRGAESYASTDGEGTLSLSGSSGMDPDDSLAQMILHEICHSMVQGPQSFGWVDWGLDNEGTSDDVREHACLRLQAALLDPFGLRTALAPTTDFRIYYDALPPDPFEEKTPNDREAITRGRAALNRRNSRPYRGHLDQALEATGVVLHLAKEALGETTGQESLLKTVEPRAQPHPIGTSLFLHKTSRKTCSQCAWSYLGGRGKKVLRCRQASGARTDEDAPCCDRFETPFDCLSCGACCREAYDTVEVSPRDPAKKVHLDLMVERAGGFDMKRNGSRCACLRGGLPLQPPAPSIQGGREPPDAGERVAPLTMPGGEPFTCEIYETRPRTCRDFALMGDNCLTARRFVGMSR